MWQKTGLTFRKKNTGLPARRAALPVPTIRMAAIFDERFLQPLRIAGELPTPEGVGKPAPAAVKRPTASGGRGNKQRIPKHDANPSRECRCLLLRGRAD